MVLRRRVFLSLGSLDIKLEETRRRDARRRRGVFRLKGAWENIKTFDAISVVWWRVLNGMRSRPVTRSLTHAAV